MGSERRRLTLQHLNQEHNRPVLVEDVELLDVADHVVALLAANDDALVGPAADHCKYSTPSYSVSRALRRLLTDLVAVVGATVDGPRGEQNVGVPLRLDVEREVDDVAGRADADDVLDRDELLVLVLGRLGGATHVLDVVDAVRVLPLAVVEILVQRVVVGREAEVLDLQRRLVVVLGERLLLVLDEHPDVSV